jgi:hypothetical protein
MKTWFGLRGSTHRAECRHINRCISPVWFPAEIPRSTRRRRLVPWPSTKNRKISEVLDDGANRGGADSRRYAPYRAEHALCQIEPVPVVRSVITRIVETVTAVPVTPSSTWTAIINSGSEMNVNSNARAVSMAKPGEQQRFATPQLQ